MPEDSFDVEKERRKLSKRWNKYGTRIGLGFLAIIIGYLPIGLQRQLQTTIFANLSNDQFAIFGVCTFLIGMVVFIFAVQTASPYRLSIEEKLFLDVGDALEHIETYVDDTKEPDRRNAEKKMDDISRKIEEWDIGDLKICKTTLGPHVKKFAEVFYRKMVGTVKQTEKGEEHKMNCGWQSEF